MKVHAIRYHDISCGHTVYLHEGKCACLHGHNYRVTFYCETEQTDLLGGSVLDEVGRVVDFSVIKSTLCMWLEDNYDHRFLVYEKDPRAKALLQVDSTIVIVPFNPTAENLALYLLGRVGPKLLDGTGVILTKVTVEETRKCSASAELADAS